MVRTEPPPSSSSSPSSGPPARRRRTMAAIVVIAAAVLVVAGVVAVQSAGSARGAARPDDVPGRPYIAYEPGSFLRTPLPDDAPVDAQSADGIDYIKRNDPQSYPEIRGVQGNKWGMPFAVADCSDPVWYLTGNVPPEVSFLRTEGFHAPRSFGDGLTLTSDSPFVVVDRCGTPAMPNGLTVWAAKASPGLFDTIFVGAAGAYQHDSNGLDRRNPRSDSKINFRGRGAIPDAMVVRDDLLGWGMANGTDLGYVLHLFWQETDTNAGFVHPMVGAESDKHGFGAEGMRIRIKPDVDLTARKCSPAGLVVARTLQRYGAYLGDNAGGATSIKAQQDSKLITADALSCVTWNDFEFVQRGWDG